MLQQGNDKLRPTSYYRMSTLTFRSSILLDRNLHNKVLNDDGTMEEGISSRLGRVSKAVRSDSSVHRSNDVFENLNDLDRQPDQKCSLQQQLQYDNTWHVQTCMSENLLGFFLSSVSLQCTKTIQLYCIIKTVRHRPFCRIPTDLPNRSSSRFVTNRWCLLLIVPLLCLLRSKPSSCRRH